ncbi:flagellar export protein FliJ [Psychrosphaera sp. F3M07]|uniref:flagellar export protein FliJ n=1 Tax=Psychrosphaera sp. F3M07 TaxID=2841560 RepID=UPI001C088298|nr:flagellar export protein FliJ [Psychrosphaera sp. F3M07]MBU2917501.1 flagellar export protein FliJ [Psychrosphaera sp. F3M07]
MAKVNKQLELLLRIESEKEQQFATELQSAQSFLQAGQTKLKQVQSYKLEYLKRMQAMGDQGVLGGNYQHFQRFIVQLEAGIKKQIEVTETSKQVLQQRKSVWLEQSKKVKAVQTLIDKKRNQIQMVMDKEEQSISDEFASQKFIRNKIAAANQVS